MRMWMIHTSALKAPDLAIGAFQGEMNSFLRKLGRRPEFRVVDQSVQVCTVYDTDRKVAMTTFTGIVWYEKVRKEADA